MTAVDRRDATGSTVGSIELDEALFGVTPHVAVMHQVVTAQLAARRSGTQSTLTRSEVAGGGAKPWRQKGTGRARQGSIRAPQWVGGGVAFGPKPRSYAQRTPKKMIRLALRSALSDRAAEGKIVVVDWGLDAPSTKAAAAALRALDLSGRVLVVLRAEDEASWKSFRNLQHVHVCEPSELNAYDILAADWVVFTEATLPTATARDKPRRAVAESRTPVTVNSSAVQAPAEATVDDELLHGAAADVGGADAVQVPAGAASGENRMAEGRIGGADADVHGGADADVHGGADVDVPADGTEES